MILEWLVTFILTSIAWYIIRKLHPLLLENERYLKDLLRYRGMTTGEAIIISGLSAVPIFNGIMLTFTISVAFLMSVIYLFKATFYFKDSIYSMSVDEFFKMLKKKLF